MDGLTTLATSIYLRPAQNTRHTVRNQESLSWWQVGTIQRRLRLRLKLLAPVAKALGWFNRLLSRRAEHFPFYNLPWMCSTPPYHDDTAGGTDDIGLPATPEATPWLRRPERRGVASVHVCLGRQLAPTPDAS